VKSQVYGKKNVSTACVSALLIILMFSVVAASARTYSVGVKTGDWAGFGDISFEWASNMPGYEQPPFQMNMSWMDMEVLDVHNSNVTVRSTVIYKNGTKETYVTWGDIVTGEGNLSTGIIPSNLGPGDPIPANFTFGPEFSFKVSINGTVTRRYACANREVNYVNITYPIVYDTVQFGTMNISLYWDKKTGIACEEIMSYATSYTHDNMTYYMNMSILWRMTATNMWPAVFSVLIDGQEFNAVVESNSTISDFDFRQDQKEIRFSVTGPGGTAGFCNVSIPTDLMRGEPWVVLVDDVERIYIKSSNGTHTFLYFTYTHTTRNITIRGTWVVPEFPTLIPLLLVFAILAVFIIIPKRRTPKHPFDTHN